MSTRRAWQMPSGVITAVSIVASVVIGIWLTVDDLAEKTLIAVAVGMLTTIVGLQIDTSLRLSERARRQDQHGRLLELVEQQPPFLPAVTDMLASAINTMNSSRVPLFKKSVTDIVESARMRLSELERGRLRCPANDSDLMIEQWGATHHRVRATTIPKADMDWWLSAVGLRYLEHNASAVRRGVQVERIFLLDDREPETIELLNRTVAAGVSVLIVDRRTLPADLRINVVVYDDVLSVDELTNADGEVVEFIYSTNPADLARILTSYGRLRSVAQPYRTSSLVATTTIPMQEPAPAPSHAAATD
jgi:hypothetical protein